jgi:hypothetical protein
MMQFNAKSHVKFNRMILLVITSFGPINGSSLL